MNDFGAPLCGGFLNPSAQADTLILHLSFFVIHLFIFFTFATSFTGFTVFAAAAFAATASAYALK